MSALIQLCTSCSATYFPPRLICRRCGSTDFTDDKIEFGVVEDITVLVDGSQIASVACPQDVHFIARVNGGTAKRGDQIQLTNDLDSDSGPVAFVPFRGSNA